VDGPDTDVAASIVSERHYGQRSRTRLIRLMQIPAEIQAIGQTRTAEFEGRRLGV
jgi:hypothetical protein